jgi:guanine deaminase
MSLVDIEIEEDKKLNDESRLNIESDEYKKQFLHEATKLAIESVEKGWGGPFGAVIVRNGRIIGRGQNRVL